MLILGIESSCDETAAAVVKDGREVLSNVINSQIDIHKVYGGVVPEIASRMHAENISYVVEKALSDANVTIEDIDGIAVTYAPGLIGALLVGINFAKGLSFSAKKPLIPVHHIRGHVAASYLTHNDLKPPFVALIVSGGHSHL
ncbi:MAG: tRNA (adenosine(37)-N6)-threonylcarbamoyltransferase complex transferase subunit TsaD, partial [Clostridia bacterium]|nr:tRNA (adenosine(37)-N6)-threonylcarbamoyltransferase complex transferase subunit TsaD [Clostridia bacterium]